MLADGPPSFPGTERFRPMAVIGRGAMGVVYRARDVETDGEVALKALEALAPHAVYGLKREFRTLAEITHPNLIALYELVVADDRCFFSMEYVEGVDVVSHVRSAGDGRLGRLLPVARQMVAALATVHAHGKLHRDVKPSNVLVTPDGRAVVLDFGLAAAFGDSDDRAGGFDGTLAYAAPEQIWGGPRHPAADWYAVGVLLYEALTGQLPFDGPAGHVAVDKARARPAPPSAVVDGVPPALDALVHDLLDPDPARRPAAAEIAARLDAVARGVPSDSPAPLPPRASDAPFVGREAELLGLRAALAAAVDAPRVVHVAGASGIGKSALVGHFVADEAASGAAVALCGRCHLQEAVAFNALDGVVDALAVHLARHGAVARDVVPRQVGPLVRLFPVLRQVETCAADADGAWDAEPRDLRRRAVAALRRLLVGLAARQPLVVWIDDVHWADADSIAVLEEILRPPGAPPMLLVLSARSDEPVPLVDALADVVPIQQIGLPPLDVASAGALAASLCDAAGVQLPIAEVLAAADGSPFVIGQIAWAAGRTGRLAVRLGDVLGERLADLAPEARDLLEVVALAAGPLERHVALDAAGAGRRGRPLAYGLQRTRLLRPVVVRQDAGIEVYHDRIRDAVVGALAADRRRLLHGRIADAIARTPSPDPQALFTHHLGAGRTEAAQRFGEEAGDRAAAALAFDRAASLYEQVAALCGDDAGAPSRLLAKQAAALGNAGRSARAGAIYEAAARHLGREGGVGRELADLERRAAEQYLRAGMLAEGTAGTRTALARMGVTLPTSAGSAVLHAVGLRLRQAWRGLRVRERATPVPDEVRARLDALWGATATLAVMDQVLADAVGVRHFLDALDSGDAAHAARALGLEAAKAAQLGGTFQRRRGARLLDRMGTLVAAHGAPYERAYFEIVSGVCAYQSARWRDAHDRCRVGSEVLRAQCTGVSWELATAEAFALSALAYLGELRELTARLPDAIADAEDRGDRYAAVGFRAGILNLVWLAADRPDEARRHADEAIARWPSTGAFTVQHYLHLIAACHADLYTGDAWAAWQRIRLAWPLARRALFLAMETPRVELRFLRARVALACATAERDSDAPTPPDPGWPRARLLAVATRDARRIAADRGLASAAALAAVIRGGVASATGENAAASHAEAAAGFDRLQMALHAAAVRVVTGATGDGAAWMERQGVTRPDRLAAVLCPGSANPTQAKRPTCSGRRS